MPIISCNSKECTNPDGQCHAALVTFEGAVLGVSERNGCDDSDFIAFVWDATEKEIAVVTYGSTAYQSVGHSAIIDASDDVIDQARAWARDTYERKVFYDILNDARRKLVKGARVKSTTTRGKNKGVIGEVVWIGGDRYRRGGTRVGVKVDGEESPRWLDGDRVQVTETEVDSDEVTACVSRHMASPLWFDVE